MTQQFPSGDLTQQNDSKEGKKNYFKIFTAVLFGKSEKQYHIMGRVESLVSKKKDSKKREQISCILYKDFIYTNFQDIHVKVKNKKR